MATRIEPAVIVDKQRRELSSGIEVRRGYISNDDLRALFSWVSATEAQLIGTSVAPG